MPIRIHAKIPNRFLEGKIREKHPPGQVGPKGAQKRRLAGTHHMGMRSAKFKSSARPASKAASEVITPRAVTHKIDRLANDPNSRPRVLDLFAGCGGLSLGFESAGCDIAGAIEIDELAARSHGLNFYKNHSPELVQLHGRARDITKIEPDEFANELSLGTPSEAFDIIVGGPPCQAYARVGRAKLREIAEHPEAFKIDPRGNLYLRYLHYIKELMPLAVLMENVPDILNYGGHNIVQEIVETLDIMGYTAQYSLINSAHHGVPQMRDRVYMIAFRKELKTVPEFPRATHNCVLPSGYQGTRSVALKLIDQIDGVDFAAADTGTSDLPAAVTTMEALGDLPPITLHREGMLKRGARRFTELAPYRPIAFEDLSQFAQLMRTWKGFENDKGVFDHVLRFLPRDTTIFEAMQPGDEYPAANKVANVLFEKEARRKRIARDSKEWKKLHRAMVPPYDPSKFPNRWWKLRADGPSRTLMAHIGKDTYSHIHYDSAQARVITVREAARLQSFPDGFIFAGTMNSAFRQIGNAVPPLMARSIAEEMLKSLFGAVIARRVAMIAAE